MKRVIEKIKQTIEDFLDRISSIAPPGVETTGEWVLFWLGLIAAVLFSFSYLAYFFEVVRDALQEAKYIIKELPPGQEYLTEFYGAPDFFAFLDFRMSGFLLLLSLPIAFAAKHYAYYYLDSKSIYTMKRLGDPLELHKRALFQPMLMVLITVFTVVLLLLIYYRVYLAYCTPEGWLRLE